MYKKHSLLLHIFRRISEKKKGKDKREEKSVSWWLVKESGGEKRRKRKMQNFNFYHPGPSGAGYYPYYAPQFIPHPHDQQQQQQAQQPLASSGVEKSTKQKNESIRMPSRLMH